MANRNHKSIFGKSLQDRKASDMSDHTISQDLRAVVDIADQLIGSSDLDELYRRAVELARKHLHVERCAILINRGDHLSGTYGTDLTGKTTDERGKIIEFDESWKKRFSLWNRKSSQWVMERDIQRSSPDAREAGRDNFWVASTPIKGEDNKVIAVFCNDAAITRAEPNEPLQDIIAVFCSLLGSIFERQSSIDELQRRDTILEGVSVAASRLLTEEDLGTAINASIEVLGEALDVDRVYIFKNHTDPLTGEWFMSQLYEWASHESLSELANPDLQDLPYEPAFAALFECLVNGRIYGGPVDQLPESEQEFLAPENILSLLVVPIFINNEFWGFIGFDDCRRARKWTSYEKSTLFSMAGNLGAVITKSLTENEIKARDVILSGVAKANHELLTNHDLAGAIVKSLETLATAVNVERICLCENTLDLVDGEPVMCPRYVYHKNRGACARYEGLERQLSYREHLPGWHRIMSAGKPIHGRVLDFLGDRREDVRSVLLAPLMIENKFWGIIGFDSADPERNWDESDVSTLSTMAGSISGAIARKRADETLRSSEEHFRSLIENTSDITLVVDNRGHIHYGSPAVERTLGYKAHHLPRINFFEIIHPTDWPEVKDIFYNQQPGEDAALKSIRLHNGQGQWLHTETAIKRIPGSADSGRFVVNARDITQRVLTEEALRRSEDLLRHSQKMEAIGRLAGGISHDFNNLLTAILGYGDLLKSQIPEGHDWRREVEEIHNAAKRAHSLTRQLLAFSRRQVMEPVHLDLNTVVRDMERLLIRLIGENLTLSTDTDPEPCPVKVDRGQIEQVIINLALNARDAMQDGGDLRISTRRTTIREPISEGLVTIRPGDYILLKVGDSGHGIGEDVRPHIFEPFFTTKEVGKGTGLGLSMVYGTIQQSGGHILFETEVGSGTVFTIYFPRVGLEAKTVEKPATPTGKRGSEKILLIEDDEIVRELSSRILESQGYTVIPKVDGAEALAYFEKHAKDVDMVVTDIIMPNLSGVAFARAAREIRPDLKILFMSGYSEDHQPELHETANGRNYIQKPFTVATLCSRIREILDSPAETTA